MKEMSGISTRWELLSDAVGKDIKNQFSAYSWYQDDDIRVSKSEHWHGWWNDCFDFVSIWAKSAKGKRIVENAEQIFSNHGYTIQHGLIDNGIGIVYETMTEEESRQKAHENLIHGGRMSD